MGGGGRLKDLHTLLLRAKENRYVLLVFALGLTLLLLPRSAGQTASAQTGPVSGAALPLEASGIPMDTEELRLAQALGQMRGVGQTEVLLSKEGAIIICAGADDPEVRLEVTEAVSLYTGLGYDRIHIVKMKP